MNAGVLYELKLCAGVDLGGDRGSEFCAPTTGRLTDRPTQTSECEPPTSTLEQLEQPDVNAQTTKPSHQVTLVEPKPFDLNTSGRKQVGWVRRTTRTTNDHDV